MLPFSDNDIVGSWATVLLATDNAGLIDYKKLADEIDILIDSNPNGIYSNGTSGEFYTQTETEFDEISMLLAAKCNNAKIPFQIGVSSVSPQISLERLKRVKNLQPLAVQLILPDWYPVSMEETLVFLQKMEENAGGISLILYTPPHAKKKLEPKDWATLKKYVPSLRGVKVFDQNADPLWYAKVREYRNGLSIFIPGHRLATGIKLGAQGSYSNMACLNPYAAQQWYNLIISDLTAGLELEKRISIFMQQYILPLIIEYNYCDQACDRFMAILGGWADVGEKLRWPYKSVPKEYANEIKEAVKALIPEFFVMP